MYMMAGSTARYEANTMEQSWNLQKVKPIRGEKEKDYRLGLTRPTQAGIKEPFGCSAAVAGSSKLAGPAKIDNYAN
jgi:hypothetical protein